MLIPRFSLRWLLVTTAICSVLAFVLAQAVRGHSWAIALSIASAALVLTMVVHAVVFVVALSFASVGSGARRKRATSPFAMHVTPPQLLPPHDPD